MDSGEENKLLKVWRQKLVPVIYREEKGRPLLVRLKYSDYNRQWLQKLGRSYPEWNSQYHHWEVPKSWFNDLVECLLKRCGQLYVIQSYNENEKCCFACQNAIYHICQCSCMGANHGSQNADNEWFSVSEAFVVNRKGRQMACRLMQNNLTQSPPTDST
ncbi:MAG: hypothetical protein HRT95_04795 [Moritella sp.]|nr:hypothetical protein [Moritella sp.]